MKMKLAWALAAVLVGSGGLSAGSATAALQIQPGLGRALTTGSAGVVTDGTYWYSYTGFSDSDYQADGATWEIRSRTGRYVSGYGTVQNVPGLTGYASTPLTYSASQFTDEVLGANGYRLTYQLPGATPSVYDVTLSIGSYSAETLPVPQISSPTSGTQFPQGASIPISFASFPSGYVPEAQNLYSTDPGTSYNRFLQTTDTVDGLPFGNYQVVVEWQSLSEPFVTATFSYVSGPVLNMTVAPGAYQESRVVQFSVVPEPRGWSAAVAVATASLLRRRR